MDSGIEVTNAAPATEVRVDCDIAGVQLAIGQGLAAEFMALRSAQLKSILQLLCAGTADQCEAATLDTVLWLAASFAKEVDDIIPIALREASLPPDPQPVK